jgi:hypothetical protein
MKPITVQRSWEKNSRAGRSFWLRVPDRGNGSGHSERVGSNQQIHNGHYYFGVFPSSQRGIFGLKILAGRGNLIST